MAKEKFTLTLTMKRGTDYVHFKQDGQRFEYNCTIKMAINSHYEFLATLRPPYKLDSVSIKDTPLSLTLGHMDRNSCSYHFDFHTAPFRATKPRSRDVLPIVFTVEGMGILTIFIQVKFYKSSDSQHSTWGSVLHHLDFECCSRDDKSSIDVINEIYR